MLSRSRGDVELRDPIAVDVGATERAAEAVAAFALDHELTRLDATLQAIARLVPARFVKLRRAQAVDSHALPTALQRVAVQGAAALARGRSEAGKNHGQYRKDAQGARHRATLLPVGLIRELTIHESASASRLRGRRGCVGGLWRRRGLRRLRWRGFGLSRWRGRCL